MDESKNYSLIGACGVYCGSCSHYKAFLNENKESTKISHETYFDWKEKIDLNNIEVCKGCHSDELTKHCSECKIRLCAKNKNVHNCSSCNNFPCSLIKELYKYRCKLD